jgi:hypothetical protein
MPSHTSGRIHSISSTEEIGTAIVNSFKDNKSMARESVDKIYPGCG